MKAFLAILTVLLFGLAIHAQPEAPVVWGEARWLGIGNVPGTLYPAALMGDSLVLVGALPDQESPPRYCPAVIYSHDNGQTFGPWQCLDSSIHVSVHCHLSGCGGRVFAFVEGWTDRSVDAGMTWAINRSRPQDGAVRCGIVSGLQVISIDWQRSQDTVLTYTAAISDDGGDHWRTGIPLPPEVPQIVGFADVAVTQSHILLLGYHPGDTLWLLAAAGDRSGQNWSPFVVLPRSSPGNTTVPFILGDSSSETAMVRQLAGGASMWVADLYVYRTTDGGQSWEAARNLSEGHPLLRYAAAPELFCRGKLWGVVWEDFWNPDTTQWGVYWRLSANHGKDWYPAQPLGLDVPSMAYSGGQFVGHEVRVYWNDQYYDYATATGLMTEDTVRPELLFDLAPVDTIRTGDSLWFEAEASDNDTLSEVRAVVMDSADQRTVVVLSSQGNHQYRGGFVVPHDGLFRNRGEAEDFWENVATDPDSGWLTFHTEGWSGLDNPLILHPSSFILSVFPNPCNGWPHVRLSPDWFSKGPATITVYNVLGQKMLETRLSSATMLSALDAPAATGLYLLEVSSATHHERQKLLVLK